MHQLTEVGTFYFGCSFTGHCAMGQKVQIDVTTVEEGPASISVAYSDGAGNAAPSPATSVTGPDAVRVTVDTTPPAVAARVSSSNPRGKTRDGAWLARAGDVLSYTFTVFPHEPGEIIRTPAAADAGAPGAR